MRGFLATCLGLLLAGCSAAPVVPAEPPGLDDARQAEILALLTELAQPPFGTGAALSLEVGENTYDFTAGHLWEGGPTVTPETRFNWASVSKLLTAARVHALAAEGRLDLGDSVQRHLPGVALLDESGQDRASTISLRDLLAHRSGLPHVPAHLDPEAVGSSWTDPALLRRLATSWTIPLAAEPKSYNYSNTGYALLAALLEAEEGASFADAMQPFLLGLGMEASTFWALELRKEAAHGRVAKEGSVSFLPPGWYASRYALPFTGLWASAADMARFGRSLLEARRDESAALHPMVRHDEETGHGLGPIFRRRHGEQSIEHDGGGPGFAAWLIVIPAHELVFALACNADGETRAVAEGVMERVEAMLEAVLGSERSVSKTSPRW